MPLSTRVVPRYERTKLRLLATAAISAMGLGLHAPGAAGQQHSCTDALPELEAVTFTGNRVLSSKELSKVIALKPSSWLRRTFHIFGTRRCLDEADVPPDIVRLLLRYRQRGYARAMVSSEVVPDDKRVAVRFRIDEARPLTLDSVVVRSAGPDTLRSGIARAVPLRPGDPLDRDSLDAARTATERWLRDRGYLAPHVRVSGIVDSTMYRAFALIDVETGPLVRLGAVHSSTRPYAGNRVRLSATQVHDLLSLRSGATLDAPSLERARQRLANTDIYDGIAIRVDSLRPSPAGHRTSRGAMTELDSGPPTGPATEDRVAVANVHVDLTEAPANQLQLRGGYGTLDCIRLQAELQHTAFLKPAGHLELSARLSKIAIGSPLDFAPGLCSGAVQEDPYSQRLNFYFGATYRYPALSPSGIERSITLYTERRAEYLAYLRTTYIGAFASASRALWDGWRGTLGYALSYGKTEAPPAVLCVNFNACVAADREPLTDAHPLGVLSAVLGTVRVDDPLNPSRGHSLRFEVRGSATWLGSSSDEAFIGARVDGAAYRTLGTRTVLATRLRLAAVGAPSGSLVPQQERLFAGGSTTIRGYQQNEVGPRTYLADSVSLVTQGSDTFFTSDPRVGHSQAVPTGGNAMFVSNVELRVRPPKLGAYLQLAAFIDGGAAWVRGASESNTNFRFRVTPGVGVRVLTPIGPVRVDVAYNPYAPRPGPAYRDTPIGLVTAPLYCVSPGNTLRVTGTGQTDAEGEPIPPTQEEGTCPPTFEPRRGSSFFDRLTLHFSIGQAY
jgi:outer membrane protein insertion porin family